MKGKYCGERRWSFLLVDGHRPTRQTRRRLRYMLGITSCRALADKRTCACVRARSVRVLRRVRRCNAHASAARKRAERVNARVSVRNLEWRLRLRAARLRSRQIAIDQRFGLIYVTRDNVQRIHD